MEARGVEVLTGANTEGDRRQDGRVAGVRLEDGRTLPADLVVMAVGIRPNAALGQGRGPRASIAASWSTTTCAPAIRTSSRSANASSIAASATASSRRSSRWRRSLAGAADGRSPRRATKARSSRPSSRSPASTSSRPAISPAATDREDIVLRDAARGVYKRVVLKDGQRRRRRAVRRYRRRRLVLRPDEAAARTSPTSATR